MTYKSKLTPKCVHNSQYGSSSHNYFLRDASLTVEASIIIPIFLIVMMSISSIIYVIYSDIRIRQAIVEEAKYRAMISYDNSEYGIEDIKSRVMERIGDKIANSSFVDYEMGGIDFSESDLSNKEIINITVNYHVKIPYDLIGSHRYHLKERIVMHTLTGYVNGLNGLANGEKIVYVSETGNVYHRNINCSHIRLNIIETTASEVEILRNTEGSKYRSCSICHSSLSDDVIYITSDGARYHNTLMCSGLKRNISAVPLSQVPDRRPCSRCGY